MRLGKCQNTCNVAKFPNFKLIARSIPYVLQFSKFTHALFHHWTHFARGCEKIPKKKSIFDLP